MDSIFFAVENSAGSPAGLIIGIGAAAVALIVGTIGFLFLRKRK